MLSKFLFTTFLLFTTLFALETSYADAPKTPAIETIISGNCLRGYLETYTKKQAQKAFAYARDDKTGEQACGWSFNYKTIEDAEKRAIKSCKKRKVKSDCLIIAHNDEIVVKAATFSELTSPDGPQMTPQLFDELNDKAADMLKGDRCRNNFKKYLNDTNHKAFAYTVGNRGLYFYCYRASKALPHLAEELALKKCNEKRNNSHYLKKFAPECKLFAKNNRLLVTPKDYGLTVEPLNLVTAARYKSLRKIQQLVDAGADINQQNKFGTTPLIGAVQEGRQDVVEYLISKKADLALKENLGFDALNFAAERSNFKLAEYLISKGADIHSTTTRTGYTPFHYAAYRNNPKLMVLLLDKGAEINRPNNFGWTPLHLAANEGKLKAVKYLIKRGAKINNTNNNGDTPLDVAISRKRKKVITYLKSKQAKSNPIN